MNIDISVVIPVYNVEKYLQSCINSLINQTKTNMELIFVNDASSDNSLLILQENQRKYPNFIKIIDSKVNLKQGGARNLGIQAANGEYIGFCDSDDFVAPDMYENLYNAVRDKKSDAAFIMMTTVSDECDIRSVLKDQNDRRLFIQWNDKVLQCSDKTLTDADRMNLIVYPVGGVMAGIWKKQIIIENQIFFPKGLRYEDNYWSVIIKCYLKQVSFVEKIGYFYRMNPDSTIHAMNQFYHYDRIVIEKMLLKKAEEINLLERFQDAFEYIYINRYAFSTYNVLLQRFTVFDDSTARRLFIDLMNTFPNWRKNYYWRLTTTWKQRLRCNLIFYFPTLMSKVLKRV